MIQPNYAQQIPQTGGANAVAINIYNPQAYGAQNPGQVPYNYTNSLYEMPQASAYQQPAVIPGYYQQQYLPQPVAPIYYPQQYLPQPAVPNYPQQPVAQVPVFAPQPQVMPETVMQPQAAPAPVAQQAPVAQEPVAQAPVAQEPVAQAPVDTTEVQEVAPTVNVDELVQKLSSADANEKAEAINKIAEYIQSPNEVALQFVSEPVMNALVNVINEDTSALEGPTDKQIEIADKIAKGEQLTPEEEALADQLSPRDAANKNRIFAMYTLAMIQKLQRDELSQYIATQQANGEQAIEPLKIEDLIGYNEFSNIINDANARPELKVAAIQSIQHVAEPQDKTTIETLLKDAAASTDEAVKQTAADTLNMFASLPEEGQQAA